MLFDRIIDRAKCKRDNTTFNLLDKIEDQLYLE